jgi:hypothetical protein
MATKHHGEKKEMKHSPKAWYNKAIRNGNSQQKEKKNGNS